ncbi:lipase family protein [Persicobacter diffluens]|uniref:Fungal lipase-like domain-containing protein n=1 Tax=Persicobacter diffluens TaxID=981 RepID=A0AAN5AJP0_9BACT|nr:hypothetical protein PEDI_16140 [Persicobacter diffluens]
MRSLRPDHNIGNNPRNGLLHNDPLHQYQYQSPDFRTLADELLMDPYQSYDHRQYDAHETVRGVEGLKDGSIRRNEEGVEITGKNGEGESIRPIHYNSEEEYQKGQELTQALKTDADRHAFFEFVAHNLAYQEETTELPERLNDLIESFGYYFVEIKRGKKGFQYAYLGNDEGNDIIAFRGTEVSEFDTILADLDPIAVGMPQFIANQELIEKLIARSDGKVDVTGHSLGGALAQLVTANYASRIGQAFIFQAPGIDTASVEKFKQTPEEDRPEVFHHIVVGDLVDKAGDESIPGVFYTHDFGTPWMTTQQIMETRLWDLYGTLKTIIAGVKEGHLKHVFSSDQFQELRRTTELDETYYSSQEHFAKGEGLGLEKINEAAVISGHEYYPFQSERAVAEGVRDKIGNVVKFIQEAKQELIEIFKKIKATIFGKIASENRTMTADEKYVVQSIETFDWSKIEMNA